jgi:hypothetical protein
VKTLGVGVLLPLLSIGACIAFYDALGGFGQPSIKMPVSQSIAATPASAGASARIGEIDLDRSSGSLPPSAARTGNHLPASLSAYLLLHQSGGASVSYGVTGVANACSK